MRAFKLSMLTVIAICVFVIPISIITFADNPPTTTQITTSYGSTWTIENFDESFGTYDNHESRLSTQIREGDKLVNQKNVLELGINGDTSGLENMIANITATLASGQKPAIGITTAFVTSVLNTLNENGRFSVYLDFINKWSEIDQNNEDIANAMNDRDAFYDLFSEWWIYKKGPNNPVPPKDNTRSLADYQTGIPPIGVRCGGACNVWWYNGSDYILSGDYEGTSSIGPPRDPHTGVVGISALLSEMAALAIAHKTTCDGCYEGYWTCNESQNKEHQVLYCGKPIEYWMYDSLSGKSVWSSVGICGASYRNCDDPTKKIAHRYMGVSAYGLDSQGNYGIYQTGYKAASSTAHGQGTTTAPSVSIHGVNGVGVSENRIDQTPNCTKCVDSSRFCPNASTKHSRVPATTKPKTESNPIPESNPDPPSTNPSSEPEIDPLSDWTYCVKCSELYLPVYNTYDGSCSQGGYHKDSY